MASQQKDRGCRRGHIRSLSVERIRSLNTRDEMASQVRGERNREEKF